MPPNTPFNPASPQAQLTANLFVLTLICGGIILAIVIAGVIYVTVRYGRRSRGEPYQQFGIRRLEIIWTVAPAVLVAILFGFTLSAMRAIDVSHDPGQTPDVVVIGHQWWWEYQYPKSGVITANEMHIPTGQKLLVQVRSADVIHDFWVPRLARKIDAIPGKPDNFVAVQADTANLYLGTCAEYCGDQHAWMRIRVYAQSPEEFASWQQQQLAVPATPTTGLAGQGAVLFQETACAACHTIAGTPAQGKVGPNLTHVITRNTLGTGILGNPSGTLAAWIANPQAIKPGVHMPNLHLTAQQISAIVVYLEALK